MFYTITDKPGPIFQATMVLSPLLHVGILLPMAPEPLLISSGVSSEREERSGVAENDCLHLLISLFCAGKHFCISDGVFKHSQEKPLLSIPIPLHLPAYTVE